MLRPPSTVRIGQHTYQVLELDAEELAGSSNIGWSSSARLELKLDPTLPPSVKRVTLWHEVKHVALNFTGLGAADTEVGPEAYIEASDDMELMVLRDNPTLVRYLLGDDK